VKDVEVPDTPATWSDLTSPEVISPELALVSPELRALAIAALPPIEFDRPTSMPPRSSPEQLVGAPIEDASSSTLPPQRRRTEQSLRGVLRQVVWVGFLAFAAVSIVVLFLTLVANAVR
jgi:hypothetical protein